MGTYWIYEPETETLTVFCNEAGCENFFDPGHQTDDSAEEGADRHDSWHGYENGLTDDLIEDPEPCPDCRGSGRRWFNMCRTCQGDGVVVFDEA